VAEAVLGTYAPGESPEALALDAACVQGGSLRLSFRRETFHRRAAAYPERVIFTARVEGRLAGTLAVVAKPVELLGRPARAAFAFDLRVHPAARGRGIARAMAEEGLAWARAHADLVYAYCVDDNRAAAAVCAVMELTEAGGYRYLACPVVGVRAPRGPVRRVGADEQLAAFRAAAEPFDVYSPGAVDLAGGGYLGSWLTEDGRAGCSACCRSSVLAEVVERVPVPLRVARGLARAGLPWPRRWPRVPDDGEELRSWYLFDFFAASDGAAVDLLRHVGAEARARAVDWCHVVHRPVDTWAGALRRELPRLFAPVLRYRLLLRRFDGVPVSPLARLHVDVRDI